MMKAFAYDNDGFFVGEVNCQPSPLEPGVFLIPAGTTESAPPAASETLEPRLINGQWSLVKSRTEIAREEKAKADAEAESKKPTPQEMAERQAREDRLMALRAKFKDLKKTDADTVAKLQVLLFEMTELLGLKE